MKKLGIFSTLLSWSVFILSLYLVLSYKLDAHGIRQFFGFDGWFGNIWFALLIIFLNTFAWFFPVYYLQIMSYIRKSQRATNFKDNETYLYDSSSFRSEVTNKLNRRFDKRIENFIWNYKDSIRDKRTKKTNQKRKSIPIIRYFK